MKKILYLLFLLLIYPIYSQNVWHENNVYDPVTFLNISLSNNYLQPNNILYYNVSINYRDIYYIPNASLVIQIIQKGDNNSIYPYQFNNDNEIYEYVIRNLYLQPGETINIPLKYIVPYNLDPGYYYIVAYLYTPLNNINGLPFIYYPGSYTEFYVDSINGGYPSMYIVKNDTYLSSSSLYTYGSILYSSGYYYSSLSGPTGYGVSNGLNMSVDIYSQNNANATLLLLISPWDDILYSPVYNNTYNINLNSGYNIINIDNINISSLPPNVYSARLELLYNNTVESIYRLRFIVLGPTTRLDGVFLQGNGNLTFIVAPSPDHYTYPTTPNVIAQVYSNILGFNENISLGNISWYNTQFTYVNLQLPLNSTKFDLCINLYSNNNLDYNYCTYYNINQSDTYGLPLSQLVYVNYTNNYFYICSNISGNLIVAYNSPANTLLSTNVDNNCYNYSDISNGTYYISFYSSQYSNQWIINNTYYPSKTNILIKPIKQQNDNIYYLALVIVIIIISILLYMIKRWKIFAIFIVGLVFLSTIHSQTITVSPTNLCSPSGSVTITTSNYSGDVNVNYTFFNPNNNFVYSSGQYKYFGSSYSYTIALNNLPAGINVPIEYNIDVENCTIVNLSISCSYNTYNGYIYSNYPFYFEYYSNPIYTSSDDAAYIVAGCSNSENIINNTYFNFTVILPNGTSILTRTNCSGAGDPDWGQNLCDLNIYNYDNSIGNYTYNGSYDYNGQLYNIPFVGNPLQVLGASAGTFTSVSCTHAVADVSANSSSNPLQIYFNYNGPNTGNYYTYDNGVYILAQNTSLGFNVNGGYNGLCSDGVTNSGTPSIAFWLYSTDQYFDPNSSVYILGTSNAGITFSNYFVDRSTIYNIHPNEGFVLPSGSPLWLALEGGSSVNVYNFNENNPGYYILYTDYIRTVCGSPEDYICDPNGNLCSYGHIQGEAWGWLPINPEPGYYFLVINPDATVNVQNISYYPYIYNINPGDPIYLGYIDNIGIGNLTVGENYILPDPILVNNNFLLQENQNISLYAYFPTNECSHVSCQIPYNVSYQNAYGLTVYSPVEYSGYINIYWDNLSVYTNPSITKITYGPVNLTIGVENLGPVPAENVSIYNLQYDPACVQILNIYNDSLINPGATAYLNIEINITNSNCNPQDYNISFSVYGWNTYIYNYSLLLPLNQVNNPPNGVQLSSNTVFNIKDINYQACYISFNNAQYPRNCNSDFLYQNGMCAGSICNTEVITDNQYAQFDNYYTYYNYLTNSSSIFGVSSSSQVISIYVGQQYNYQVLIKNLVPSQINCTIDTLPIISNDDAQVLYFNINGINNLNFTIGPDGVANLYINVLGLKSGVANLIYGFTCNSLYGSSTYSQEVPVYVLEPNGQLANNVSNLITSEEISPGELIGVSIGILAVALTLGLI
ncbi:hypothetical protein MJ1_0095 [Nanobdella aerobiophila]|uniref:Uncharacterized protein n=1 Tax=Nanobdella aerobiophila TaxID=2586965 RepID=A0A915SEV2_9ARCH|nr:hypothetical protein [Nanobdella aerobiophila]BBL45270.1 hypothetical protein MJ1_0095 [Nanobdella aerobiophila]